MRKTKKKNEPRNTEILKYTGSVFSSKNWICIPLLFQPASSFHATLLNGWLHNIENWIFNRENSFLQNERGKCLNWKMKYEPFTIHRLRPAIGGKINSLASFLYEFAKFVLFRWLCSSILKIITTGNYIYSGIFWLNKIKHRILPIFHFVSNIFVVEIVIFAVTPIKWSAINFSNVHSKRLCVPNITSGCFSAYANHKIEIRFIWPNHTHIRHLLNSHSIQIRKLYWTPLRINHKIYIYSTWWWITNWMQNEYW